MAVVKLYNLNGQTVGELALDDALFGVKTNPVLVHEAVVAQQANARVVLAHVKDRGEVAGSGKKPWKQKGTGRARHGSRRSPIWSGGGVTFGPQHNRNFGKKINKQARRLALAMVLSEKVREGKLIAVDTLTLVQPKTQLLAMGLKALPHAADSSLLILGGGSEGIIRAARNLSRVSTIAFHSLNVVDVLGNQRLIVPKETLETLSKFYLPTKRV